MGWCLGGFVVSESECLSAEIARDKREAPREKRREVRGGAIERRGRQKERVREKLRQHDREARGQEAERQKQRDRKTRETRVT